MRCAVVYKLPTAALRQRTRSLGAQGHFSIEFTPTINMVVGLSHCQALTSAQHCAHSALMLSWFTYLQWRNYVQSFKCLVISCPAISCPAILSAVFMPCNLVCQFHVRHFLRPLVGGLFTVEMQCCLKCQTGVGQKYFRFPKDQRWCLWLKNCWRYLTNFVLKASHWLCSVSTKTNSVHRSLFDDPMIA